MNNVDLGRVGKRVVQYFWDPIPRNDDISGSPIWCLGRSYETRPRTARQSSPSFPQDSPPALSVSQTSDASYADVRTESSIEDDYTTIRREDTPSAEGDNEGGWPPEFLDDFESRIWMTYRSNFPPIPKSQDPKAVASMSFAVRMKNIGNQGGFPTDSGWGCMIRSGQSLVANALLQLRLGRDWKRGMKSEEERKLLSLFADDPSAPFSIHRFVEHGASACGKHPGEWFGPSATAQCIQALSNGFEEAGLKVYLTGDGPDVYEDSLFKVAKSADGAFRPTLLLVGIRLGIDRVTPVYWEGLKSLLQMPQSIGIAGGRPSSSHYFVGVQGQNYFYLDPHTTRPALPLHANPKDYSDEDIDTCHTRRLRRIHISEMDPSMLIAFLVTNEEDWHKWRKSVTDLPGKPIIHIEDKEPRASAIDEVESLDEDEEEDELV